MPLPPEHWDLGMYPCAWHLLCFLKTTGYKELGSNNLHKLLLKFAPTSFSQGSIWFCCLSLLFLFCLVDFCCLGDWSQGFVCTGWVPPPPLCWDPSMALGASDGCLQPSTWWELETAYQSPSCCDLLAISLWLCRLFHRRLPHALVCLRMVLMSWLL